MVKNDGNALQINILLFLGFLPTFSVGHICYKKNLQVFSELEVLNLGNIGFTEALFFPLFPFRSP